MYPEFNLPHIDGKKSRTPKHKNEETYQRKHSGYESFYERHMDPIMLIVIGAGLVFLNGFAGLVIVANLDQSIAIPIVVIAFTGPFTAYVIYLCHQIKK